MSELGQIPSWCSIGGDGRLSPDSFRADRIPATEGAGQILSFLDGVTQHLREHRVEAGEQGNNIQ
jgi:hypothetical protein